MEGPSLPLPEGAPPTYTEIPVAVDSKPEAPLATAPDGYPVLESEFNVVAETVELPPDDHLSADARLDLKDPDTKDIGWNKDIGQLPPTIVHGLSNEDLFLLIRRFNKQIYYVKAIQEQPPGTFDLEISDNEEFSPDKLRAHLERMYIVVIIGLAAFGKHIARIRSWNEPSRTAGFCIAYCVAWWHNLLGALICAMLITLILHPPSRHYLFPPAPLAAVSATSGNLQVPRAGKLGSKDSLTGAEERHKGEAVEQEAGNFVGAVGSFALATAAGQTVAPNADPDDVPEEKRQELEEEGGGGVKGAVPDPTEVVSGVTDVKGIAHGARGDGKHDRTKQYVEGAMWDKAKPAMRVLADVVDTWEKFGNVLSPTPPFSDAPRLRLAAMVVPILLAMIVIPSALFVKGVMFTIGFVMFGEPLMTRGIRWLNTNYPNWPELLELRRSILKGAPTNAQLTLALLRIAESAHTPLPPPPSSNLITEEQETHPDGAKAEVAEYARDHLEFDASSYEIEGSDHRDEHNEQREQDDNCKNTSKLAKILKGSAKASVSSAIGLDHLKAKLGSGAAKRRLGAIPRDVNKPDGTMDGPTGSGAGDGPTTYAARYRGKRGFVVLVASAATPCVSFVWEKDLTKSLAGHTKAAVVKAKNVITSGAGGAEPEVLPAVFAIPLADIHGLRKVGGYGWKSKMIIGYALKREVVDGLGIDDEDGKTWYLTAIKGRDELFNRLIAVGGHKWEQL